MAGVGGRRGRGWENGVFAGEGVGNGDVKGKGEGMERKGKGEERAKGE